MSMSGIDLKKNWSVTNRQRFGFVSESPGRMFGGPL
jgi:hypothetical protein